MRQGRALRSARGHRGARQRRPRDHDAVPGRALLWRRHTGAGAAGARRARHQACAGRNPRRGRAAVRNFGADRDCRAARRTGPGTQGFAGKELRCRSHRREIACAARVCIFPVPSPSTSSTRRCTGRTPSFSILRIPFITRKKMRRAFWSATRCARWISASASAWCASTSCPWASKTWRRLFPNRRTWCCFPRPSFPSRSRKPTA